ncbi:hypothetical protein IAT38_003268 [Cryptococcus sp. DSM 104549]
MPYTPSQQDALDTLWAITASATDASRQRDERLLIENGWNVEATVDQIFSGNTEPQPPQPSNPYGAESSSRAHLEVEDPLLPPAPPGARRLSGTGRPRVRPPPGAANVGLGLFDLIAWPVKFLVGIVGGIWYLFVRNVLPLSVLRHLPPFLRPPTTPAIHPRPPQDPTTTSLEYIRELETFTRCSSAEGTLPEFYIGPYKEFLTILRREGKLGMVVLVSGEHEDDEEFKRGTLCDREVVRTLKEKDVLVWGGDISSREGFQVSQTLLTTTYPSLTFLSLLPTQSSPTPKLSILTTLSGPPSTTTSPTNLLQTLTTTILPRTTPFLSRLRRERLSLEEARHLREEQDRAFREAERRDREKLRVQRQKEEAERLRVAREEREAREREEHKAKRQIWRRYARKHLLPPSAGSIRVALRTPLSSERHIRQFEPGKSTLPLFIFAETLLIPASSAPADDPDEAPEGYDPLEGMGLPGGGGEGVDFVLVTAYPRKEVGLVQEGGERVWELVKGAGGALFVEKKEGRSWGVEGEGEESDEEILEDD